MEKLVRIRDLIGHPKVGARTGPPGEGLRVDIRSRHSTGDLMYSSVQENEIQVTLRRVYTRREKRKRTGECRTWLCWTWDPTPETYCNYSGVTLDLDDRDPWCLEVLP